MEKEFLISAGKLTSVIKQLKPFISEDEARYYLGGIHLELEAGSDKANMVATDGIKLCVLEVQVDRQELFDYGELKVIIPDKALDTILVMLKGVQPEFPVALRFNEAESHMFVDAGDEKGDFRLIDGDYPDYKKVIPTEKPKFKIGFSKVQAREVLKAISSHPGTGKYGLQWEMVDANSPTRIRSEGKLVVVMPMHVSIPGENIPDLKPEEDSEEE